MGLVPGMRGRFTFGADVDHIGGRSRFHVPLPGSMYSACRSSRNALPVPFSRITSTGSTPYLFGFALPNARRACSSVVYGTAAMVILSSV